MGTVATTVQFVPADRPFDEEMGYAWAATAAMPNLFWNVHPAVAHSYQTWLVDTIAPEYAATGGGLGYSFIAEAYANFAWAGCAVLALFGFGIVRLSTWEAGARAPPDPAKVAAVGAVRQTHPASDQGLC